MTQQKKAQKAPVSIVCRESGLDCDYQVRDSDENEVLTSAQAHVKLKHGAEYSYEQLRPLVRKATP